MPFADVAALKGSDLFKRMRSLHEMGSEKLRRFVAVFNEVYERAIRGGASPDEAEARAIPIALVSARKAIAPPAGRVAEERLYHFGLMARHMEHGGGGDILDTVSSDLTFPPIEDINSIMAGNAFYGPTHRGSDPDTAEPQGIIRSVIASKDAPPEIRAKVDPDIPILAVASFFSDVPEDERLSTISPEWVEFQASDGTILAVPHNFITTPDPANPPYMGIRMVAKSTLAALESPYLANLGSTQTGVMRMAGDKDQKKEPAPDEWQKKAESLHAELESVKAKLASAAGVKDPGATEALELARKASTNFEALEARVKVAEGLAQELVKADRQRKAEDFAAKTFREKEVAVEDQAKLAEAYLKDPEQTEAFAKMLQPRKLMPGVSKAANAIAPMKPEDEEKWRAKMASILQTPVSGGDYQ